MFLIPKYLYTSKRNTEQNVIFFEYNETLAQNYKQQQSVNSFHYKIFVESILCVIAEGQGRTVHQKIPIKRNVNVRGKGDRRGFHLSKRNISLVRCCACPINSNSFMPAWRHSFVRSLRSDYGSSGWYANHSTALMPITTRPSVHLQCVCSVCRWCATTVVMTVCVYESLVLYICSAQPSCMFH